MLMLLLMKMVLLVMMVVVVTSVVKHGIEVAHPSHNVLTGRGGGIV